jgi:cysteinyl-tRNA synthetase
MWPRHPTRSSCSSRIADKPLSQLPSLSREEISKHEAHKKFTEYMNDDFNTGGAVGVLFELATSLNKFADLNKLEATGASETSRQEFLTGATVLRELGAILGLSFTPTEANLGGGDALVSGLMQLLLDLRANLRVEAKAATKDNPLKKSLFDQTDLIRTRLAELNITLEDRPAGTTWRVG